MANYFQSDDAQPDEFAVGLHEKFRPVGGHDIGQFPGLDSQRQVLEAQAITTA